MERRRGKNLKVDLLITGDWHLREDTPVCRTDDFWKAQWDKVNHISELQKKYECPVIHSGDLFNHWKPSPYLLQKTMNYLPSEFFTIYGNHDLPQHQIELEEKTGIYALKKAGFLEVFTGRHWNQKSNEADCQIIKNKLVLTLHEMVYDKSIPFYDEGSASLASQILERERADLVITGHNHRSFTREQDNQVLVNPGSLTRQTADQKEHKPCVYAWNAEKNYVWPLYLSFEEGVVSDIHTKGKEEENKKIQAFVENLNYDWEKDISFETNLERFKSKNKVNKRIMNIIYECIT